MDIFNERMPFLVAAAVLRVIRQKTNLSDENAAWDAFISWKGREQKEYLDTIFQTRHSIFYHQLQELYEFGAKHTNMDTADFCRAAGREFAVADENLHLLLEATQAKAGNQTAKTLQNRIIDMLRCHLLRYTGDKYELNADFAEDSIKITLADKDHQAIKRYCREHELDPARTFANSFHFILGAFENYVTQFIQDFDRTRVKSRVSRSKGVIELPVPKTGNFNHEIIIATLLRHIRAVESAGDLARQEQNLQNDLVIGSPVMRRAWDRLLCASRTNEIVLLCGESGTGKSFVARKLHALSCRCERPFIEVSLTSDIGSENMIQSDLFGHEKGAFTGAVCQKPGLFSLADGGTIFLDEIGDASPELQARLLRVIESSTFRRLGGLQDIHVDVRIIAATHRDLQAMVRDGTFRMDLYYRLNVIRIDLPPLRERPDDILPLAELLLTRLRRDRDGAPRKFSADLITALRSYTWPGNIRELDHAIRHGLAMAGTDAIRLVDLPAAIQAEAGNATSSSASHPQPSGTNIINPNALRQALNRADPAAGAIKNCDNPAHVDYARKLWLAALIDRFKGDLPLIGRFWDRGSEKTLRKLIREFGLGQRLESARKKR